MSQIFINYRRSDAAGHARLLFQSLNNWFDETVLFFDRESIEGGELFTPAINAAVRGSAVLLAVIAPAWLDAENEKRLHQTNDMVRRELALALSLHAEKGSPRVIPVLCGGAVMPDTANLPADIRPLCGHQVHTLEETAYRPSLQRLLDLLKDLGFAPRYRPPAGTTQYFQVSGFKLAECFCDPAGHLPVLYETLHRDGHAAVVGKASLHGMGGVGKTQLALRYSHDYRDEYAGVWWFRAESLALLEQDCQQYCEQCGIDLLTGEKPHQAVNRWLQGQPCWLLAYDNAEAAYGEERQHLAGFLPDGRHHRLITSRSPELGGVAPAIPLDVWEEKEALTFLRLRLPLATDAERLLLAQALGGLPLALEQASAYIDRTGATVTDYCQAITDLETSGGYLDRRDSQTNYPLSVLATLSLAFARLSEPAQHLLRLCAWCAPEPIPESLFRQAEAAELLPEPLRTVTGATLPWRETVAELTGFSLAQRLTLKLTPLGGKVRKVETALLLHRLTQAVVIHRLSNPATDCPTMTELLGMIFPADVEHPDSWPLCQVLGLHVLRLNECFHDGNIPHRPLSWLLDRLASYLQYGPALYDQAISLFRRALELDTKTLGPDQPDTLSSMSNLAEVLRKRGDHPEAKAIEEQVLARRTELFGSDHRETLISMGNLASTLKEMGNHLDAKCLEEKALKRLKERFGPDHPDTLTSMNNLALALTTTGEHMRAKALAEEVLMRRKARLGPAHPDTLISMGNLASILKAMGKQTEAKILEKQVLECMKKKLGPQHPNTTVAAYNFLSTLDTMGNRTVAQKVFQESLQWLLAEGVQLHDARQRQIRDMLRNHLK